jgi:hypothetical protein
MGPKQSVGKRRNFRSRRQLLCHVREKIGVPQSTASQKNIAARPIGGGIKLMNTAVKEIIEEKRRAGEDTFLILLSTTCRCELWPSEDSCDVGDEREVLRRWDLDPIEYEQLIETGLADRED